MSNIDQNNNQNNDEIKEIDSVKSLEEYNQSNQVIIECSKRCDPYLVISSAAAKAGKDRAFRSVVEKCMALWLDDNKDLYELIKEEKQTDIIRQTMFNIYEQDLMIINKTLQSICYIIKKYCDNEYFIETDHKKITYCSKDSPIYETLSILAKNETIDVFNYLTINNIVGFLNVHLNPVLYIAYKTGKDMAYPDEFTNPLYSDNLLSDLVDKISLLLDKIKIYVDSICGESSFPVFYVEQEFLCLTFDYIADDHIKITYLNRTIWSHIKYKIYNTDDINTDDINNDENNDIQSTRIRLFKI